METGQEETGAGEGVGRRMEESGRWCDLESEELSLNLHYLTLGKLLNPSNVAGTQKMFVPSFPQSLFYPACSFVLRLK